jgi:hypothetical protein
LADQLGETVVRKPLTHGSKGFVTLCVKHEFGQSEAWFEYWARRGATSPPPKPSTLSDAGPYIAGSLEATQELPGMEAACERWC